MRQTSLVILEKGYEVSFTFIGGSEDEVNELIEKLSFGAKKAAAESLMLPCHPGEEAASQREAAT